MTGLNLLSTQKRGSLPLTNWKTKVDRLASPTALYLHMGHNEANTRLIFSQMAESQFLQIYMMMQYVNLEEGFFYQGWRKG